VLTSGTAAAPTDRLCPVPTMPIQSKGGGSMGVPPVPPVPPLAVFDPVEPAPAPPLPLVDAVWVLVESCRDESHAAGSSAAAKSHAKVRGRLEVAMTKQTGASPACQAQESAAAGA
jgi:hypothetical protein